MYYIYISFSHIENETNGVVLSAPEFFHSWQLPSQSVCSTCSHCADRVRHVSHSPPSHPFIFCPGPTTISSFTHPSRIVPLTSSLLLPRAAGLCLVLSRPFPASLCDVLSHALPSLSSVPLQRPGVPRRPARLRSVISRGSADPRVIPAGTDNANAPGRPTPAAPPVRRPGRAGGPRSRRRAPLWRDAGSRSGVRSLHRAVFK